MKEETIIEYGFALKKLANRAYPKVPNEHREGLVVKRFINGISSRDLAAHINFCNPKSINKALALATEFEKVHEQFEVKESKLSF